MKKCCQHIEPCGCGESVVNMPGACACDYPSCTNKQCYEVTPSNCVPYSGDTIVNLGIENGMSVNSIIQRLVGVIVFPGCNYPDSPCKSVVGVQTTAIIGTTVKLSWEVTSTTANYIVQYKLPNEVNWTSVASTTNNYQTIAGLNANTSYYVRVQSADNSVLCNSVTILVKTGS